MNIRDHQNENSLSLSRYGGRTCSLILPSRLLFFHQVWSRFLSNGFGLCWSLVRRNSSCVSLRHCPLSSLTDQSWPVCAGYILHFPCSSAVENFIFKRIYPFWPYLFRHIITIFYNLYSIHISVLVHLYSNCLLSLSCTLFIMSSS